ncbi:MAG: hypothetical protein DRH37_00810 [Deltaproteobacteria bacterium]|nr:MAG: hypothetical protein DRH37_00810 [Deltaproteobacteria bacterium]
MDLPFMPCVFSGYRYTSFPDERFLAPRGGVKTACRPGGALAESERLAKRGIYGWTLNLKGGD